MHPLKIKQKIGKITKKHPNTHKTAIKINNFINYQLWLLRNLFMRNKAIPYSFNNHTIHLIPEGHIAQLMWEGSFEEAERSFIETHIKPGMCVLNIGSNVGLYTLIASKLVGASGEVHAFEPTPLTFNRLAKNVHLNKSKNVYINQIALSNFSGKIAILPDPEHPKLDSHYFVQKIDNIIPKEAIGVMACETLDTYWSAYCGNELKPVDMIIIDVEGAELSVFEGAKNVFLKSPNLIILAECTKNITDIETILHSNDFIIYNYNPSSGTLEKTSNIKRGNIYATRQNK